MSAPAGGVRVTWDPVPTSSTLAEGGVNLRDQVDAPCACGGCVPLVGGPRDWWGIAPVRRFSARGFAYRLFSLAVAGPVGVRPPDASMSGAGMLGASWPPLASAFGLGRSGLEAEQVCGACPGRGGVSARGATHPDGVRSGVARQAVRAADGAGQVRGPKQRAAPVAPSVRERASAGKAVPGAGPAVPGAAPGPQSAGGSHVHVSAPVEGFSEWMFQPRQHR